MTSIASLFRACFFSLVFGVVSGQIDYTIINKCPNPINVYIGGRLDGTLSPGASTTRNLGVDPGFIYSDANGADASGIGTRAGFYGDLQSHYYYVVNDPVQFNMGISIAPRFPPTSGFCVVARCNNPSCDKAFSQPPTSFPPHTSNAPPAPPVYSCPYSADLAYDIIFCPSGSFPPGGPGLHTISGPDQKQCFEVRDGLFENGTPVQISDCIRTPAQQWFLRRGCTKIRLAGTDFCLDAGPNPRNGAGIQIWECQDNLPSQMWYVVDGRIALAEEGVCPGLTNMQWPMDNMQWPMSSSNSN